MVENTPFAVPGFALSLTHSIQGGDAEAWTVFPRRRELCGLSTGGMDITSQPWQCCLLTAAALVLLGPS